MCIPSVQTRLAGRIFDSLEKNLNGDISVDRIQVIPFNAVKITGLTVCDADTVLHINSMVATMSTAGILKGEGLHIGRLQSEGISFFMKATPDAEFTSNLAHLFNSRPEDKADRAQKKQDKDNILDIRKITVKNVNFQLNSTKESEYRGIGINWQDLDVHIDLIKGHNLKIGGGCYSGTADRIVNISEKSGYFASLIQGRAKVGHGLALIEDIHIIDNWSDVKGDRYSMSYDSGNASFNHYETLVTMEAVFRQTHFSVRTLGYFIDGLEKLDFSLDIHSGRIVGPMKSLNFEAFRFDSEELGLGGILDGELKGLSQIQDVVADLRLSDFKYLFKGQRLGVQGKISGPIDNLSAGIIVRKGSGKAEFDGRVRNLQNGGPLTLKGRVSSKDLDVSGFFGKSPVGKITANTGFRAVLNHGHREIGIDSLRADRISLLGYDYRHVTANGTLKDDILNAELACADSNAIFSASCIYNLSKKAENAVYRANADIRMFDLAATGILHKEGPARVAFTADGDYTRNNGKELAGGINLQNIRYTDVNGEHCLGNISLQSSEIDGRSTVTLNSDMLNGSCIRDNASGKADMDFRDTRELMSSFLPGFYIADGTRLSVALDEEGSGKLHLTSPRLAKGGVSLKELDLDATGKILLPSQTGGKWAFDDFLISIGEQSILLDGQISSSGKDTLDLRFSNLDPGILDFASDKSGELGCIISGEAALVSPFSKSRPAVNADIRCDSLSIKGIKQGGVLLSSRWDEENGMLRFELNRDSEGDDSVSASGSIAPVSGEIDAVAEIKDLELALLHPLLNGVFSEMGGCLSGEFAVNGSITAPEISSNSARLDSAMVRPALNGVTYHFDGPFTINPEFADFSQLMITDGKRGNASIEGSVTYDNFRDAVLDLNLNLDNMMLLDLPSTNDGSLSGEMAASGFAKLSGSPGSMRITADMTSAGPGTLDLRMGQGVEAATTNLLTFVSIDTALYKDPYDEILSAFSVKKKSDKSNGTSLQVSFHLLPEVLAKLDIDPASGSGLSARGNGLINIATRSRTQQLDLSGGYDITSGDFRFSIPGIVAKDFTIQEGSSIKFGGDLMDSDLNINATYKARASLSTLIQSDSTSANTRRVVECGINISDKLSNPDLNLSIDIADLDPTTKSKVDAALNTEDKIQKQFVSLLILGTFMPDDPSGIVNGGNMILSNMGEILSSQFSKILQRLDIPMDLGFKYQQNANSGTDLFDVAISTQLFNNRVYVNGNVGNRRYGTANPNGELMGDVSIEIKLDDPGQLRLNLFSRSADEYTSNLDLSQRNGVGLSYQKEYSSFRELIRNLFTPRSKREEKASIKAMTEKKETVITIGKDE